MTLDDLHWLIAEADAREALREASRVVMSSDEPLLGLSIGALASGGLRDTIAGLSKTSVDFRRALRALSVRVDARLEDLALVISFESAGSFDPARENPTSHAVGLIQFLPSTLQHLGSSYEEARQMTAVAQLSLVEKYFQPFKKPLRPLSRLYMAVLYPRMISEKESAILFKKGSTEYDQNENLDINKDGSISIQEATRRVSSMRHGKPFLLLFGDSLAEGLEPHLARLSGDDAGFAAVWKRGTTAQNWLGQVENLVDRYAPSVVVISLGSNDRKSIKAETVQSIVSKAASWGADVHWLSPLQENATLTKAVWDAGATLFETDKRDYARGTDNVHLLPQGYAAFADDVWQSIGGKVRAKAPSILDASPKQDLMPDTDNARRNRKALAAFAVVPLLALTRRRG